MESARLSVSADVALEFATGDALLPGRLAVMISFPNSQSNWVYSVFLGALYNMGQQFAWIEAGETTSDEAATQFRDIFDNRISPVLYDVGDIKWSSSNIYPAAAWLPCNGAYYGQDEYPDLYAAIGTNFNTGGEPSGTFRVPDMLGRVAVTPNGGLSRLPSVFDSIGGAGGESAHQLTIAELASHAHTDAGHTHAIPDFFLTGTAVPPPFDGGAEVPHIVASTGSASANIQNTGGGAAHNNVQPAIALYAYILAEL